MTSIFTTTPFGQFVRLVTAKRCFRYPDEIDPTLWRNAVQEPSASDVFVVGWYGEDDAENPRNWPDRCKYGIVALLCALNFAVYLASSIYVPGEPGVMADFHVGETAATLGLSLFTVGYGLGPMLWSPLSEMPRIGRSRIFVWTLLAFLLLQLAVGFAPNLPVLLVFRLLSGFAGSPCLATGGGTIADLFAPAQVAYMLAVWAAAGVCGPVFGPIVGGYLAQTPALSWRWTIWAAEALASVVFVLLLFFLPETSAAHILHRRAARMAGPAGWRPRLEEPASPPKTSSGQVASARARALGLAFSLTFAEPIVLLMDLYTGLVYGVLFLWFESFPLVFGGLYGFDAGQQGLAFLGIFVGAVATLLPYLAWVRWGVVPRLADPRFAPESVLPPAFVGSLALPVCLFWYGWTARVTLPWILPVVGAGFFTVAVVTLFNTVFHYLALAYPLHMASIFAGNALFRALFGAVFPLFARSLFRQLGIGPGNSLLGGIAVGFIPIPFVFYHYGARIRRLSKHAVHN